MKTKISHESLLFRIFFSQMRLHAFNPWVTGCCTRRGAGCFTGWFTAWGPVTSCPKIASSVLAFVFSSKNGVGPSVGGLFFGRMVQLAKACLCKKIKGRKIKGINHWGSRVPFEYFLDKCRGMVFRHGAIALAPGIALEGGGNGSAPWVLGQETAYAPQRAELQNTVYSHDAMADALGANNVWNGDQILNPMDQPGEVWNGDQILNPMDQPGEVFGILGSVYPKTCSVSVQKRMRQSWYF